jgi:hypothetical protein
MAAQLHQFDDQLLLHTSTLALPSAIMSLLLGLPQLP